MEKNDELRLAWNFIEKTGTSLFLTGKAGTGKTTFLRTLKERSPKRMVVLAPTGIAAINAGGVTIHSFFQLPLSPYVPGATFSTTDKRHRYQIGKEKRKIMQTVDLLVIDEISMARADLLDAVDATMRRFRNPMKPFGGAQLLLIGDLQQLAPVVKDEEWEMMKDYYDTPYFFSSKALAKTNYKTIELRKVYRQSDAKFLDLLNRIRTNQIEKAVLNELNSRYIPNFQPPTDGNYIRLTTHNRQADLINEQSLQALTGTAKTYGAKVDGDFPESSYPAEKMLKLKPGTQVMFIKNSPEQDFYNGMIGEVVSLGDKEVMVKSKDNGKNIKVTPMEWTNSRYTLNDKTREITETVEGRYVQLPLRLAWAITIHKSQGLTFEHAIIDVSHSFAHGQTYVALSRCKTLEGLVLSAPIRESAIINDDTVNEFTNDIAQSTPTQADVTTLQQQYTMEILDELFSLKTIENSLHLFRRTLSELPKKFDDVRHSFADMDAKITILLPIVHKFREQYSSMYASIPDITRPDIQERIHKASVYFANQLRPWIDRTKAVQRLNVENKQAAKPYRERSAQLYNDLSLKLSLFDHESKSDTQFTVSDYLKFKAHCLVEQK